MRALIEQRLADFEPGDDSRQRMLANVVGEVSKELLEAVEQPNQQAAVLIGLVERERGLNVLFTARAAHLKHHPGQISFPGGRLSSPEEPVIDAALREAWEEIHLAPKDVTVAGCLGLHITGTGFRVTPVVGFIADGFEAIADPAEVSDVFEVPLDFILDESNVQITYRDRFGSRFRIHEFVYAGQRIWGATAAMLMTFTNIIRRDNDL